MSSFRPTGLTGNAHSTVSGARGEIPIASDIMDVLIGNKSFCEMEWTPGLFLVLWNKPLLSNDLASSMENGHKWNCTGILWCMPPLTDCWVQSITTSYYLVSIRYHRSWEKLILYPRCVGSGLFQKTVNSVSSGIPFHKRCMCSLIKSHTNTTAAFI